MSLPEPDGLWPPEHPHRAEPDAPLSKPRERKAIVIAAAALTVVLVAVGAFMIASGNSGNAARADSSPTSANTASATSGSATPSASGSSSYNPMTVEAVGFRYLGLGKRLLSGASGCVAVPPLAGVSEHLRCTVGGDVLDLLTYADAAAFESQLNQTISTVRAAPTHSMKRTSVAAYAEYQENYLSTIVWHDVTAQQSARVARRGEAAADLDRLRAWWDRLGFELMKRPPSLVDLADNPALQTEVAAYHFRKDADCERQKPRAGIQEEVVCDVGPYQAVITLRASQAEFKKTRLELAKLKGAEGTWTKGKVLQGITYTYTTSTGNPCFYYDQAKSRITVQLFGDKKRTTMRKVLAFWKAIP